MDRAEEIVQNTFSCPICLEVLRQPKSLLCGHNLCGNCLHSYIHREHKRCPSLRNIKCPQCRETTPIPDPSKPVSDWLNQFKTNCGIQNIIEDLTEKTNKDCDVCRREGREVEAQHHCKTCNLLFCQRCQLVHRQIPACELHDIQDTGASQAPAQKIYEFRVHLNSATGSRKRKQLPLNLKKQLRHHIAILCERMKNSLKEKEEELIKQVDVIVDELFERFVSHHPTLSLSEDGGSMKRGVDSGRGTDSSLLRQACSAEFSEEGASYGSHRFCTVIRLASKVEPFVRSKYNESLGNLQHQVDFRDEENTSVKQVAGSLSIVPDENVEVVQIDIPSVDEESSSSSDEDCDFIPVYDCTIQSKVTGDDNDPWIRDIAIMDASDLETVVVTDFNNSCVKSFFKSNEAASAEYESSRLILPGKPWGVTEIQNERVAVTVPSRKTIYIIRVNPKLKMVSDVKISKEYYGIAKIDSTTLVASAPKEKYPGVFIIDFTGRTLKTITTDTRRRNIFEAPYYIAMASSGDIMVADEKLKRVIFVTTEGLPKARGKSKESYRPKTLFGIAGDSSGNLFLVDREASNVVLVSEHEDEEMFLTKNVHGINFPRCIGLYKDESLYVVEEGSAIKKFLLSDK